VGHGGKEISTIDFYGSRFVLLAGPDGTAWTVAGNRVAHALGVPLHAYGSGSS
jgi:hypothetical protein